MLAQLRIQAHQLDLERLRLLQMVKTTEADNVNLRMEAQTLANRLQHARYSIVLAYILH